VLRFWETKFTQVKPLKRGGGRRYYRPEDVALIKRIHHLLYTEGYTIKGVQKLLKGQGKVQAASAEPAGAAVVSAPAPTAARPVAAPVQEAASQEEEQQPADPGLSSRQRAILEAMLGELKDLRSLIRE